MKKRRSGGEPGRRRTDRRIWGNRLPGDILTDPGELFHRKRSDRSIFVGRLTRDGDNGTIFALGIPTVMEFTGTADGLELAGRLVKSHGRLGIGGYHNDGRRSVDYCLWDFKAFTAINCHERRISYEAELCKRCMELLEKDIWKFRGVTKVYQIEDFDKVSDMMIKHTDGSIKAAFRF